MRTTTKHRLTQLALVLLLQPWSISAAFAQNAAPGEGPSMITEWGEKVTPENAWREYPRPQMKRERWTNLNGNWDYAITPMEKAEVPEKWDGEILVPFPLESRIGGVQRLLQPDEGLWYRRTFDLDAMPDGRLLLHFEAVDYKTTVWVNGKEAGTNVGGSLPFSFDITDKVTAGRNEIRLKVTDRTDAKGSFQLVGKQRLRPGGITYTRVSGIWQTVWLEEVPETHIRSLKILGGMDGTIRIEPSITGEGSIRAEAWLDGAKVAEGGETLRVENPKLWSPDSPTLYDLKITMLDAKGEAVDAVESYTGLREVGKVKDADGNWRFTLNGEEIFHWGPLDQGWWPGGLLTPPSEEAMLFELDFLKKSGFNMIRKHIKVEPSRYYYHCDRMGFLVWQDQVSGGASPPWERLDPRRNVRKAPKPGDSLDAEWPDDEHAQWMAEHQQMIDHLYGHPSIVVWTPFNERWGQHRTMKVGEWVTKYDPSRQINIASGGNFFPVGDIADMHSYPHPTFPFHIDKYDDYIKVVGEFGGHGWKVEDHVWVEQDRYMVYGGMPKDVEEFKGRYAESIRLLAELKAQGVAGGVYTQTTDIEREINGLMTYDRKVIKIPAADLEKISRSLFEPLPETATYLPVSSPHWKFTTKAPAKGWFRSGFDDSAWKTGIAGFGSKGTPGVTIQTDWTGREIWLRKSFGIGKLPEGGEFRLLLYHDEDVNVYLNGVEVVARRGYTTDYISVPLDAKARKLLKAGENVIAIHVRQTRGGQGIDAGLEWRETSATQAAAETAEPDLSLAGAAIQALVAKGDAEVLAMIKGSGGAMALTPEKARKFIQKALDQGLISKDDAGAPTTGGKPGGKMPDFQQVGPALQALAQAGDKEAAKLLQSAMKTGTLPLTSESANALIERARAQGLLGGGENAKASPPDRPMLWKVTGKNLNAPSYLFGTIHTTTDRIRKFHPAAEQAFAEADVVVTEVPMSPEAQLEGQPLLMHGKSKLSERLDEETYGKLSDALKAINPELTPKPFEPLKTWAVAYQLIMLPEQIKGRKALDQIIWNRATDEGKTARGADTIENQYTAFDVLNEEEQITFLEGAIEQAGSGENMLQEMVALYEKGDKEGIHTLMQDDRMLGMGETEEHRRIAEKLNAKLLGERDQRMTANIVAMLEAEPKQSHFFALGTAHFLGEESIRAQLQEEGYTVVAVEGDQLHELRPAMSREEIEAGLASHDRALFIKEGWIRDPYITLGPDDFYYLTGTTPNPGDPREQSDPYNVGLWETSIVGATVQLWRSKDLVEWEYLGTPFTLERDSFHDEPGHLVWAPEFHWIPEMKRWALLHCPSRAANFALGKGSDIKGPWAHPMGQELGHKHDPSLFRDPGTGTWWMLWRNTLIAPLSDDFSRFTAGPVRIDPSGERVNAEGRTIKVIGHEGATMQKIGDKYVHFGTAWSTDQGRKGSYNLYYCTSDEITGPYGPRKFAGRFLGHGTPFQTRDGKWWCTAFFNANVPPLDREGIQTRDLSETAQTINHRGTTIVPLDVRALDNGEIHIRAKAPDYAVPGPEEVQQFGLRRGKQAARKPTASAAGNEKPDPYLKTVPGRWSKERINAWYAKQPWLVGCNYYPATAINQIEMWQKSTWDPEQIDKELGWAADIGMNTLRVYLHDLVWADDEEGLYSRMDEFLNICRKHGIRPWFVFFDDCHFPNPTLGEQPLPVRAFHNSGWVNSPSRDLAIRYAEGKATEAEVARLKGYVQATMTRFGDDERVLMWELYNEPGRGAGLEGDMATTKARDSIGELSNRLVYDSWVWAREVSPSQPIMSNSSGSVGRRNIRINRLNSDLHSIHSYGGGAPRLRKEILEYQKDGRPVMVTEWLARDKGSRVETCLPVMKELNAGAVNWGFVSGKSATIWNWESRRNAKGKKRSVKHEREAGNVVKSGEPFPEPEVWFHDLLRMDGTPYDAKEIETFKTLTSTGPVPVGARAADRPDIVVFLSDDHTWRDSSVYGSTEIETPHMARLAKAGMTFDRAFVASPSCAPSRAALLTGLYPANNGAEPNHSRPDADIRKLPAYLQELGYEVVSFGKVGHYAQTPEYGFDLARHFGYHEDIAIPKALEWLRERDSDQPLCLFVGSNWPHVPWPKKSEFDPAKLQVPPTHVDNPTTREWRAKYLAAVRKMDGELGQVYDLAREKLGEDTFFLHTSDHGAQWPFAKWNLYDDGIRTPLIVSWAGRIEAGKRTDAMVSWIDILPTLLDVAGGEAPKGIDGRSFFPVLEGTAESHRDVILTTHSGDGSNNVYPIRSALTADGWKYIRNLRPDLRFNSHATRNSGDGGYWDSWVESAVDSTEARNNVRRYQQRPAEELYRVTDDRWEMKNLIDDPTQAERVAGLRKTVDSWMAETGDPQEIYGTPVKVAKADAPNIVTVFIDDMGWSDVSCFGGDVVKTENIDRLAAEGMKFTQFYVNSPICSPSRTALTTGQYPQRWRITSFLNNRSHNEARGMAQWLDPAAPVLARELQKNGYATGHFGKWHMGGQRDVANAPPISDYGFDRSLTNFEGMGAKLLPLTLTPKSDQPGRIWEGAVNLGEPVTWMQRSEITAGFVDAALDFIDEAGAKGQPFFVNVWPDDVHSPFFPPVDRWGDGGKRALYHAVLNTMDEQLGVLFDRIRDDEQLRDNTLIVFCSDNGHEPGAGTSDPLRGSKTWLYEGGIRSPLIVWGPGLLSEDAAGQTNDSAIFSAIDLNRSLYALTDTPLPEGHELDGENVLPAMLGKAKEGRQSPIFFRRPPDRPGNDKTWGMGDNPDLAVRDGKWKYLVNYDGSDPQLYDLEADIAESENLVAEEPAITTSLREAVFAWNATLPLDAGDPGYAGKSPAAIGPLPENQFVNPIAEGADPWVVRDPNADRYLWCFSEGNRAIAIHAGQRLTSLGEKHIVWTAPDDGPVSQQVWAPELHFLDGKWHIYFAASDGKNENHLAYVLISADADPLGEYTLHGPLETGDRAGEPVWAIDMTVLEHEGKRYALWSGWDEPGSDRQYLYAAAMKSPAEVVPPRVRICSNDDFPWEFTLNAGKGRGLNEAPQVIKTDRSTFVTYSCGASWKPTYKLGRLELTGRDPLDPLSWVKHKRPVFTSTDRTFGVGHSCFVPSPDGSQLWHVYHAKRDRNDGWRRGIFVQPMDFGPKGFPRFFRPVAPGEPLDRPSGEKALTEIALPFESPLDSSSAGPWSLYGHHQRIAFADDGLHLGLSPEDPINDYRSGEKVMFDRALPDDFRAEVTIDFRGAGQSRDAGIVFRATGPAVGYDAQRGYFVGLIPKTNLLVLGKMDGRTWTELARAQIEINPTQPQRLAVEVKGDRFAVLHNGSEALVAEDSAYASGRLGLRVVNTHAVFRQFSLTRSSQ